MVIHNNNTTTVENTMYKTRVTKACLHGFPECHHVYYAGYGPIKPLSLIIRWLNAFISKFTPDPIVYILMLGYNKRTLCCIYM